MIDSCYSGESYKDSLGNIAVDMSDSSSFFKKITRYYTPLVMPKYQPYLIDYQHYSDLLLRVKILPAKNNLLIKSAFMNDMIGLTQHFDDGDLTILEPGMLEGLMVGDDINPLGLTALLLRKSYGNRKFRDKVNSELLQDGYSEVFVKGIKYYIRYDLEQGKEMIETILSRYGRKSNSILDNMLVNIPDIWKWRD